MLKCGFFNHGTQVASCGGDGLVKIWCLKTSECITTLDKHSSKVWAMSSNDYIFTISNGYLTINF